MKNRQAHPAGREHNYDLLKIISSVAVIFIHVSATYKNAITDPGVFGSYYHEHLMTTILYNTLSRFAVPCFVMVSGAFILSDRKNGNYSWFYRKSLQTVGIQTIVFSLFYLLYSLMRAGAAVILKGDDPARLFSPVMACLLGRPYYHMWYLYMIIGVYLLAPVVIRFRSDLTEFCFSRVSFLFLCAACLSMWTSRHGTAWDIGVSFCYLGYFMMGNVLRNWAGKRKNNVRGLCFIAAGVAAELLTAVIQYRHSLAGISEGAETYSLISPQSPLIVLASVLIFAGFSLLQISRSFRFAAEYTFLIYLIHPGVWDIGYRILVRTTGLQGDNRILIPVCTAIVLGISCLLAAIYRRLWTLFDNRFHLTRRLCRFPQ